MSLAPSPLGGPPPVPAPPSGLPWLMRRGLGFAMLASSLVIPGCVAVFT